MIMVWPSQLIYKTSYDKQCPLLVTRKHGNDLFNDGLTLPMQTAKMPRITFLGTTGYLKDRWLVHQICSLVINGWHQCSAIISDISLA